MNLKELQAWLIDKCNLSYTITELKNLERLFLHNNNLTHLPDLSKNTKLRWLNIEHNGTIFSDYDLSWVDYVHTDGTKILPNTTVIRYLTKGINKNEQ